MVSIVILTHNQWDYTKACLESIATHTPEAHEVIIVDNGSTDGTPANLSAYAVKQVIANKVNLGFAAGCNQGISAAGGGHVLLLNNDVIVTPGWLSRLTRCLEADPKLGAVGPVSNHSAGFQMVEAPYNRLNEMVPYATGRADHFGDIVQPVGLLIGFCLLIRGEVLRALGGLDVRYGIGNYEDNDLCMRIHSLGYDLGMVRGVFVHHFGSVTLRGAGISINHLHSANWKIFCDKWNLDSALSEAELQAKHGNNYFREKALEMRDDIYIDPVASVQSVADQGGPAALTLDDLSVYYASAGRNDPCPCGSGQKFKKCHG